MCNIPVLHPLYPVLLYHTCSRAPVHLQCLSSNTVHPRGAFLKVFHHKPEWVGVGGALKSVCSEKAAVWYQHGNGWSREAFFNTLFSQCCLPWSEHRLAAPLWPRFNQYYTRVELDLKWRAYLPWRRLEQTWNPLNIPFLSTKLTNKWMKWEGKEQLSFLFLIFFLDSVSFFSVALGSQTLSICFALKDSLEQKWNAQLADIQKKWDTHVQERHASVSIDRLFIQISLI